VTDTRVRDLSANGEGEAQEIGMDANGLGRLLDIELEANIRFGSREMSLAELLEVGPGAVIPLDRQVTDPVDLIIGDKVVARGEVVLVQGKFGLRVTEVISE
jgi:flagellar motor switch protein FliN/FliY